MKSEVDSAKKTLRKEAIQKRKSLTKEERIAAASKLKQKDISVLKLDDGCILSGYYPIRSELNCLPFMENLRLQNIKIALPVVQGDNKGLLFKEWTAETNLIEGDLKILTPDQSAKAVLPDVLLIPLLAFDNEGYRLGYGKGHYDRTLASLKKEKKIISIGIAYDFQEVEVIPHDQFDQRLDWVLTPSGLRKLGE